MSLLAKNTFLLTIASVGQKAISFLYFAFVARMLGDETLLGSYFLALALVTTIGVLDDLGMTSVLIREVAKKPAQAAEFLKNVLGWKLFFAPIAVMAAFFAPTLLGFSAETTGLVQVAIGVMLADTLSLTFYGVLRGLQNLRYEAIGVCVGQVLTTIVGTLALVFASGDLRYLILALLMGSVWNAVFSGWQVVHRLGRSALVPTWTAGVTPLRMASMFFLAGVFVKIYSYVDSFTIRHFLGEGAVGVYSVAYKLTYAFQFLPLAFVGALYPTMSAAMHDRVQVKKIFLQSEWYLAMLAAPIIFGLIALAPEIVHLVYTERYAAAVPALQFLLIGLWFIFLDFPIGSTLNAAHQQHVKTGIMGATMIINILANLTLIPIFGISGAGISAIITFIFMFTIGFYFLQRVISVKIGEWWKTVGGITLAGLCMLMSVSGLKWLFSGIHPLAWLATIPLGAGIFFFCGYMFGGITAEHVKAATTLIKGKKTYGQDPVANE